MKKILLILFMIGSISNLYAQHKIKGSVTDANGIPLIGATVLIKGTKSGTSTDTIGDFLLKIPKGKKLLLISYIGYKTQEVDVEGKKSIVIILTEKTDKLDEVVVTGYSEIEIDKLVSSIAVVKSEQLENIPLIGVREMLQGRAAGVYTSATSGQPGSFQEIRIRGTGSVNAQDNPLWVIDGIISTLRRQINPNDIESISVLKDATATALYGSRGANGVIVITTKRGKAGKTDLTVKLQTGTVIPNFGNQQLMTAEEQLYYEREVWANDGLDSVQIIDILPDSMLDNTTNWLDEAFNNGSTYNLEVQAQGGNDKTRFFLSGGFFNQDGILYKSNFKRLSLRSNLDLNPTDRINFSLNLNPSFSQSNSGIEGGWSSSPMKQVYTTTPLQGKTNPATGKLYTGMEGKPEWIAFATDNFLYSQPLNAGVRNTFRLISKLSFGYKILESLQFTQNLNLDWMTIDDDVFYDPTTFDGFKDNGVLENAYNRWITLTTQTKLKYSNNFGSDHSVDILGVFEYQYWYVNQFRAWGRNFASGKLRTLNSAAEILSIGGSKTESSFLSYITQFNYAYKNKYILTSSLRWDGSSRFGANNRWANFWSLGASWRIGQEQFIQNWTSLNQLRFRTSYGTSGNPGIGNHTSRELYGFNGNYQNQPVSAPVQIPNPDLTWEVSHNMNLGLDFAFLDSRLGGTIEWYQRETDELLFRVPIPATSGFTTAFRNIGKIGNKGLEITLNFMPFKPSNPDGFSWKVNFNISFNKNKVIELPNDGKDIINGQQILREGYPINSFYMRKWAGANPVDGTPQWESDSLGLTGNFNQADRYIVGNAQPKYYSGLTNTFSFKRFTLTALLYTAQGQQITNWDLRQLDNDGKGTYIHGVQRVDVVDHWKKPGDISSRPQPLPGGNNNSNGMSTRYLEDNSYFRLRNIVLSYQAPTAWLQRIGINSITVYAQGQNLWTQTKYSGMDPEARVQGWEAWRYPVGKSFTFGMDVIF